MNFKAKNTFKLLLILFLAPLVLSGCISVKNNKNNEQVKPAKPVGVYKTLDKGAVWETKNLIYVLKGEETNTMDGLPIRRLFFDPNDDKTLYAIAEKGFYITEDEGNGWRQENFLQNFKLNDISIDPFDSCIMYVTSGRSIYKTTNCMKNWEQTYFDDTEDVVMTVVVADKYKNNRGFVYAGNNKGDILKSKDYGKTWKKIKNIGVSIRRVVMDKDDTRILYFVTGNGLFKTIDGGETKSGWADANKETNINETLRKTKDALDARSLVEDATARDTFILVTRGGLLRTEDAGNTWKAIKLVKNDDTIYDIGIDPNNGKTLYYFNDSIFYISTDGGETWQTKENPTGGRVVKILPHPSDSGVIYLGVMPIPAEK